VAPTYGDRHDVGYTRYGDRHDVRYTDHERSTSNAQLSTFNRVTERADGGRNMGTDTEFGRPDRLTRWTCPTAGRTVQAGCGAQTWGQTRCPVYRSGTFNVKRSTLNFQRVTERAHGGWDMGTDTEFGRPNLLTRWTCPSAGRSVQAGCGAQIWGQTRCRVYPIWGQTRCPVYRSGTFNVKRSTLNFQWGDRKGAWWAEYGDRHGIWTTGLLPRRT
jgi:hypothetical protein